MCYKEMNQCSSKPKSKKQGSKKAKAKVTPVALPAESKGLPKVEVKSDASASDTNKTGPEGVEAIDADSFLRSMAYENGLDFDGKRSRQEWEKLIVTMAGKIY